MTTDVRISLIKEAIALEEAGGTWEIKHAAAVCGKSPSFMRNSDCPKHMEPAGPRARKGQGKVVLLPAEVRAWKKSLLDREREPRARIQDIVHVWSR